ncbi:MAG: hypothetical protein ACFWTJ_14495 [Lachnoclostridium sp.]|jgi:uncharacterized protein
MKNRLICFLIGLCLFSLTGCEYKGRETIMKQIAANQETIEDIQNQIENDTVDTSDTLDGDETEPVTGDDLTVAAQFAKDLSKENFDRLLKAYSYDEAMAEAMNSDETKKTILFYNAEYGEVKKINDPYVLSLEGYEYVIVPVESSNSNFSYQIAFDGEHHIVGFTYGEYAPRDTDKEDTIPNGVFEEEYSFTSDGYVIPGTFTAPEDSAGLPVVILIQGFGPLNRDEGIYENKPFRDIAWSLAKEGIASFRFDKRSYLYGEQMKEDTSVTIKEEVINDVLAAVAMVKKIEQVDPTRIYLLGHSLGGYVIPMLAESLPEASGFIILSAPAQHIKEYIYDQYKYLAEEDEIITAEEEKQLKAIVKEVKYLNTPEKIPDNQMIMGAYRDYWVDLSEYYPVKAARDITKPVLVLWGERDFQVTMDQFKIWEESFKDLPNWSFKSYANLNHFMMPGEGKSYPEEYKTKSHVADEVIQDLIQFIINN